MSVIHYGRKRPACRVVGQVVVTTHKKLVTCALCRVEIAGREMLADFRRDLEGDL